MVKYYKVTHLQYCSASFMAVTLSYLCRSKIGFLENYFLFLANKFNIFMNVRVFLIYFVPLFIWEMRYWVLSWRLLCTFFFIWIRYYCRQSLPTLIRFIVVQRWNSWMQRCWLLGLTVTWMMILRVSFIIIIEVA